MGDRRAGDVDKRHLENGLSSEDPGPTGKGREDRRDSGFKYRCVYPSL
jgi:hypothetical protein